MFRWIQYSVVLVSFFFAKSISAQSDLMISSLDGLAIHAKLYEAKTEKMKMMLLCHQARYSKGEYKETAPQFNLLGFTCLAIDQRSGDSINNDINGTAKNAKLKGKATNFEDAEQDIKAALYYLYNQYGQRVILVGSSYSSSLILKIAAEEKDKVEAVISFSPGEYFNDPTLIQRSLKELKIPVFITCSKSEIKETKKLIRNSENQLITFFKPKKAGKHGSKALWADNANHEAYWQALQEFLKTL